MNNKNISKQVETITELCRKWEQNNVFKERFAFGYIVIDKDEIVELFRDTFLALRDFKICLHGDKNLASDTVQMSSSNAIPAERNLTPDYLTIYSCLIAELGIYSAEVSCIDESENLFFTVTQVITRLLLDYVRYCCGIVPTNENGVLYGTCEECEMSRPLDDNDAEFWDKTFKYDTKTGDISEILELVKRAKK